MTKIYAVDALNILYRSYFAIGSMTNSAGQSTGGLYGFIRSVYKLIKDFSPDHLVITFDGPSNKAARSKVYEGYKSHRKPMPDDLVYQLGWTLEFCKLAGIPILQMEGVEADDLLGSIATWAEKKGFQTYLCSSDKDLCQLVSPSVFLLNPHKEYELVDEKKVEEIYGVTPSQIIDYLSIMGDASDNIPGLPGFGPKMATKLLNEMGTLEEILAHPEKVPGEKKQETIRKEAHLALMSKELVTIYKNLSIPHDLSFYSLREPNLEALRAFYQDKNFSSLLKELGSAPAPKKKKEEQEKVYHLVDDPESFQKLLATLEKQKVFAVDTETNSLIPRSARLVGIGFGFTPGEAWYVPTNGSLGKKTVLEGLSSLFSHRGISIYGHNIKYDLHVLLNEGLPQPTISFDTMIASYLVSPQKQKHNLDDLSFERFEKVKTPITDLIGKGKNEISMDDVPIEKISLYCDEDVDYTVRLYEELKEELSQNGLTSVNEEIEIPLLPVLAKMERRGIFVDKALLKELSVELAKKCQAIEEKIYEEAGEPFNLGSPKQLSEVLFVKMKIPPPKKIKTGFSTSADVLSTLQDKYPIISTILDYRTYDKLRSTYVDALPDQILPETGRIHCTFNQSVAATGRLSCQNPNLQNIPIRSAEGKRIREAFRPEKKGWQFLSADYSQIELRILAHLSEDPSLLKAFQEGEDIHAFTASLVFDVPLAEVTSDMRQKAKAVNFGVLYGQQAFGLSQGLAIGYEEASSFIKKYFDRYKKVKDFFAFCIEGARKTGKVVTMTGRHRPIPEITNKNPMIRAAAERLAINTPLQGTSADLIKMAMISIDQKLPEETFMLLQIHDELLFEAPEGRLEALSKLVKKEMEGVCALKVPLEVHIALGKNWGEC